jgi:hypothetical protein
MTTSFPAAQENLGLPGRDQFLSFDVSNGLERKIQANASEWMNGAKLSFLDWHPCRLRWKLKAKTGKNTVDHRLRFFQYEPAASGESLKRKA